MPTPPTITNSPIIIGESNAISTWGKLRTALVNGQEKFSVGIYSLYIEDGFHPEESLFFKCSFWPVTEYDYTVSPPDIIAEYGGIINYIDVPGSGSVPDRTFMFLGGWGDSVAGTYYSQQMNLDYYDCTEFFTGRLINSIFTTTDEWWEAGNGQEENGTLGGYTTISGMTAFN